MKTLAQHYDPKLPDTALITVLNGDLRALADPDGAAFSAFACGHTFDQIFDGDAEPPQPTRQDAKKLRAAIDNLGYDLVLREFSPRTEVGTRNFYERCEYLASALTPPKPAPDAMRGGTRLPNAYDDGFAAGQKHEIERQITITLDRDWLGRMVRHAWIEWAKKQDSAKPGWLLPYEELSEPDKEADRQIGEYLIEWAKKYVPAALSAPVPPADGAAIARDIVTEWLGMFDPPPQIDFQQSEFLQQAIAGALGKARTGLPVQSSAPAGQRANEIHSSDGRTDEALAGQDGDSRGSLDDGAACTTKPSSIRVGSERSSPSETLSSAPEATVSGEWQVLPYATPQELVTAFKRGRKFVLHYHGKTFDVTSMEARQRVVYVQLPALPVKVWPNGRSGEGDNGEIWLASPQDVGREAAIENRHGIYIASKTKHAEFWRRLRHLGDPIISTWIDEADEGESGDLNDLWRRCLLESSTCKVLIVYREPGEVLKGAWVEIGAALQVGIPVYAVGLEEYTIAKFRGLTHFANINDAFAAARSLSSKCSEQPGPVYDQTSPP